MNNVKTVFGLSIRLNPVEYFKNLTWHVSEFKNVIDVTSQLEQGTRVTIIKFLFVSVRILTPCKPTEPTKPTKGTKATKGTKGTKATKGTKGTKAKKSKGGRIVLKDGTVLMNPEKRAGYGFKKMPSFEQMPRPAAQK